MKNNLFDRKISVFSKIRRGILLNNNDTDKNSIIIKFSKIKDNYKEIKDTNIINKDEINIYSENNIKYNLIRKMNLYGIDLNIDIFIYNNNILFFIQNVINIYNPLIKNLRTIFTKEEYFITCSTIDEKILIVILFSSLKKTCIQTYDLKSEILKEEICLNNNNYYENIFIEKKKNYYILITNNNILNIYDVEKKQFIFNLSIHSTYENIKQYNDIFIFLRNKNLYAWNIEETYIGLKLKENKIELDENYLITCFYVYEKNIFYTTTNNKIYLWKDLSLKIEIQNETIEDEIHNDGINYICYFNNYLITKGKELLKLWRFNWNIYHLNNKYYIAKISLEREINTPIKINKIITNNKFIIIIDKKNCSIYMSKCDLTDLHILYNNNNKIKHIFYINKYIYTFGLNGQIYNYIKNKKIERNLCLYKFKDNVTCLKYLYKYKDYYFLCIGFINGLIKIIRITYLYFDIVYCIKISNDKIIKIANNENSELISIISENESSVFFIYKYNNDFNPLGYLKIKEEENMINCFYHSNFNSFYILGEQHLFRIDVNDLRGYKKKKINDLKNNACDDNDNKSYDIICSYEIIKICFNEETKNISINKVDENKYKEENYLELYNKNNIKNEIDENNIDENEMNENGMKNENEKNMNEDDNSDLSDDTYNKIKFYIDKNILTNQNNMDFEIKKKNLKKYIEIIFNKNIIEELEREKKENVFLRSNMKNNRKIKKTDNLKNNSFQISSIVKIKEKGILFSVKNIKQNCLFFLDLNKKTIINEERNDNIRLYKISPVIIFEIDEKKFSSNIYITKMILIERKFLLFCITNKNEIYIFSTKYFYSYYYFKLPNNEKITNIFVQDNENKQYIFLCLNNNFIKMTFSFSLFHLFNIILRYHLSYEKFISLCFNEIIESTLYNVFIDEMFNFIIEKIFKKKKKIKSLDPFTFKDIEEDVNFFLNLLKHEQKIETEKRENDIWKFVHTSVENEKIEETEEEKNDKIERRKEELKLLTMYDEKNMNHIFNINTTIKDEEIEYSLCEMKEAKNKEEKEKIAILHKNKLFLKIRKLKNKFQKLYKKKKFIIDIDYSYNIYNNLKDKINEIRYIFIEDQKKYDDKIKYLIKEFLKIKSFKTTLSSFHNNIQIKCIKTYLKNTEYKDKIKEKKKKKNK